MADVGIDVAGNGDGFDQELQKAHAVLLEIDEEIRRGEGDSRSLKMVRAYVSGATLESIGEGHKLTRERVRQLINKTRWKATDLKKLSLVFAEQSRRMVEKADRERVIAWSFANPGSTQEEASEKLGIDRSRVRELLGERSGRHPATSVVKKRAKRWSDEELIELLWRFHEETGSTVATQFTEWSRANGGPTKQTPMNRFGKWSAAIEAAGIAGSYSVDRERLYSNQDMWAIVIDFFREDRTEYTYRAFESWLAETPNFPSGSLIRVRLGKTWQILARDAQRLLAGYLDEFEPEWVSDVLTPRDWSTFVRKELDVRSYIEQALEDRGPILTIAKYNEWALENDAPAGNNLIVRSGISWAELVRSCGGRVGLLGRRGNISEEELLEPLREYLDAGGRRNYEAYSSWASERGLPVAGTISEKLGGWSKALAMARGEPTDV